MTRHPLRPCSVTKSCQRQWRSASSMLGAPFSGRDFTSADLDPGRRRDRQPAVREPGSERPESNRPAPPSPSVGRVVQARSMAQDRWCRAGPWHAGCQWRSSRGHLSSRLAGQCVAAAAGGQSRRQPDVFCRTLADRGEEVEPTLQIRELMPLDAVGANLWLEFSVCLLAVHRDGRDRNAAVAHGHLLRDGVHGRQENTGRSASG